MRACRRPSFEARWRTHLRMSIWVRSYSSMLVLGSARLLVPDLPASITNVLYAQGGLFEVLFGLWLLVKAVDTSRQEQVEMRGA